MHEQLGMNKIIKIEALDIVMNFDHFDQLIVEYLIMKQSLLKNRERDKHILFMIY